MSFITSKDDWIVSEYRKTMVERFIVSGCTQKGCTPSQQLCTLCSAGWYVKLHAKPFIY